MPKISTRPLSYFSRDRMQLMAVVLSRSVGAEKAEDLPFGDLQAEMIQRHQVAVPFDQIFHLNDHRAALRFYLPVYQGTGVRAVKRISKPDVTNVTSWRAVLYKAGGIC